MATAHLTTYQGIYDSNELETDLCLQSSVINNMSQQQDLLQTYINQARFQQRQLQEKEEKLLRLYEEQQERQERALHRVKGQTARVGSGTPQPVGVGKVRTLLQYRRDHGRDKSHPLDPLPKTQLISPPEQSKASRTKSFDTRKPPRKPPPRQNVLYFGGSHQDLHFSDELDYNQSFQVIDDQLLYDAPHNNSDTDDDFHIRSFNNKRQFYESRFTGVSEENLSDFEPKTFQKLPNVGLNGSFSMQKAESPKYKTFVSGKSTIRAAPARTGLPTRQAIPSGLPTKQSLGSPPVKKPASLPPARPKLGLDSPPSRSSPDNLRNGQQFRGQLNGAGSPPPRPLNGAGSPPPRKPITPPQRTTNNGQVVPPVPASRTTIPRSASSSASTSSPSRKPVAKAQPVPGLAACKICGRNFAPDRVGRHESICQKTVVKKRKVFDPVKQRVEGTEAAKYVLSGISAKNAKQAEKVIAKKPDWRKKHEDFINNIRAAKQVQDHLKKGGKLADLPPPPPSDYSDYVQCPHCQRKFNETAAERHIPKCATMMHNKPKPAPSVRSTSTFRKK